MVFPKEIKFISLLLAKFLFSFVAQLWPRFVAFPTRNLYAEQFVKASLQHVADTELVTVVEGGRNGWTVDWWIGQ